MIEQFIAILEQYGVWGLAIITFLDSIITPTPPELLLIPLSLLNPERAFWLAFITTGVSVAGACAGYWLGHKGGRPLLHRFFKRERVEKAESAMQEYGVMAVLVAAITPIPYKLITITSGVLGLSLYKLIFWSILGRSARFFLEAFLIVMYGGAVLSFLESPYFALTTVLVGLMAAVLYYLFIMRKKNKTKKRLL